VVQLSRPRWRSAAIAAPVLAGLVAFPVAPAAAGPDDGYLQLPDVVASDLNNPRHLRWSNGGLYVAEAGIGGSGPCFAAPEGGQSCYGASGSITRIKNQHQFRMVTRLPSMAAPDGTNALGAADLRVHGRHYIVALGLGAKASVRASLPPKGKKLATVSTGRFGHPGLRVVADIGAFEASANPDGGELDTNPVALLESRRGLFVVAAGGNALLKVKRPGPLRTVAVFPATPVADPPEGFPPTMDAVPTAAAYGPDGAIYVSQLTGFPFPVGGASIWRVVPGRAPTKYATDLTNVTDLAFGKNGSLYAVQIADTGLADPGATGSVVRIPAGGGPKQTVVSNLTTPYGITLHGHSAYVTTCSTCAGGGQVLRIPLGGVA
jgi:hypothetical protein